MQGVIKPHDISRGRGRNIWTNVLHESQHIEWKSEDVCKEGGQY